MYYTETPTRPVATEAASIAVDPSSVGAAKAADPVSLDPRPDYRRFYVSVRVKYLLVLVVALLWAGLSIRLSAPWLHELAKPIGFALALFVIAFIAYVPGFMNAFLIGSILADRRPRVRASIVPPDVCVLVACYNEGGTSPTR